MPDLHTALRDTIQARVERAEKLRDIARSVQVELKRPELLGAYMPGWHDWPDVEQTCGLVAALGLAALEVLERHEFGVDFRERPQCWHCANLCHSRSGLMCDEPDGAWPCPEIISLACAWGVSLESDA